MILAIDNQSDLAMLLRPRDSELKQITDMDASSENDFIPLCIG